MDAVILYENNEIDTIELLTKRNLSAGIQSLDPAFLKRIWKPDIFIGKICARIY